MLRNVNTNKLLFTYGGIIYINEIVICSKYLPAGSFNNLVSIAVIPAWVSLPTGRILFAGSTKPDLIPLGNTIGNFGGNSIVNEYRNLADPKTQSALFPT